jgi:transposase-like protein
MTEPQFAHEMTVAQFDALFPDDDACRQYLVARRWPFGVRCPRCGGNNKISVNDAARFQWRCYGCSKFGYRFSVLVGTIFEDTKVSLRTWFKVIYYVISTERKRFSSLQVQRMSGVGSHSTADHMCRRIRVGLANPDFRRLMGIGVNIPS